MGGWGVGIRYLGIYLDVPVCKKIRMVMNENHKDQNTTYLFMYADCQRTNFYTLLQTLLTISSNIQCYNIHSRYVDQTSFMLIKSLTVSRQFLCLLYFYNYSQE